MANVKILLLPEQSEDVSGCVEGGKDNDTKTRDPHQKDTLTTHRHKGCCHGYSQT